ncbi:hypothetical protein DSUL_80004 [Desulfovibrionales bacterium]
MSWILWGYPSGSDYGKITCDLGMSVMYLLENSSPNLPSLYSLASSQPSNSLEVTANVHI